MRSGYINRACQRWDPGFRQHHGTARQPGARGGRLRKAHWQAVRMRVPFPFLSFFMYGCLEIIQFSIVGRNEMK